MAAEEALKARIRKTIAGEGEARAAVARALRSALGEAVARRGGEIAANGSLVFPDTVLFEVGRADITPELRAFLAENCAPWFRTLETSGVEIAELRIEGHASSEWDRIGATPPDEAYLLNLELSQARAHAVLSTCLELVPGPEGAWARARATAIGFSSSRPVLVDEVEDAVRSRRVVFGVAFDRGRLIDAIENEVAPVEAPPAPVAEGAAERLADDPEKLAAAAGPDEASLALAEASAASGGRALIIGVPRIVDGDGLEIDGVSLRLHGIDAPEHDQTCRDAAGAAFACGSMVRERLAARISGRAVVCTDRGQDRYDRTLGVCYEGGEDLGAWLVDEGYAFAYKEYSLDYVSIEEGARARRAGLWSGSFQFPWDFRRS